MKWHRLSASTPRKIMRTVCRMNAEGPRMQIPPRVGVRIAREVAR